MHELYEAVKDRACKRLKYLGEENAKEIVEKGGLYCTCNLAYSIGMFYQNPTGYALKRYCYYMCFKCKKPYYGGERACNAIQRV